MSTSDLGIFVGVEVQPADMKGNRRFFDQFLSGGRLRDDVVVGNWHVTAQYPEEIARAGLAEWEQERLGQVAGIIMADVAALGIIGEPVVVDASRGVQGRKKWWVTELAGGHFDEAADEWVDGSVEMINDVRAAASAVVAEELNIRLADYSPEGYHIAIARRGSAGHKSLRSTIPPPTDWVITGFDVGVHTVDSSQVYNRSFVNRPII